MAVYDKDGNKLTPKNSTPEERAEAEKKGYGPEGDSEGGGGGNNDGKGMFDFKGIMDDFYDYNPTDDAGRATKASYQANMVQSALDSQLAQQLATTNAGLAQQNMTHQAELELNNQTQLMENEFNYGQKSMKTQFKYENKFAINSIIET